MTASIRGGTVTPTPYTPAGETEGAGPTARLAALAAEHAPAAEADRRLTDEVAAALLEAGFARHFVPAEHGGRGSTFALLLRETEEVARGCAATAWCGMIYALSSRMAALLPGPTRRNLWGRGPDVPIAAALNPAGAARPVPGGWRLTGRWGFLSGVDFAHWSLLCAPAERGGEERELRYFLVPREQYEVHDTWLTLGLRGTGGNTVQAEDLFVPEDRSYPQATLLRGLRTPSAPEFLRVPLLGAHAPAFVAPALGAARAAVGGWADEVAQHAGNGSLVAAPAAAQATVARATGELDAAGLLLERAAAATDTGRLSRPRAARNARDASLAASLVRDAVERVFHAGGSRVQAQSHPLQRTWRDVQAATSHAALNSERSSGVYARYALAEGGLRMPDGTADEAS
ncbi:acyl-CoA dehydrogenase family protein [Streptomyces sp. NPDC048442]|uniref:acyl-CoA dehydrogenase family protein n=1 Tax=Streptomyces sp. NPDC048442 TaxID=3154823 RepID=UPI0034208A20